MVGSRRAAALASRLTGHSRNRALCRDHAREALTTSSVISVRHEAQTIRSWNGWSARRPPQNTHASCGFESTMVSPRTLISSGSRISIPNLPPDLDRDHDPAEVVDPADDPSGLPGAYPRRLLHCIHF